MLQCKLPNIGEEITREYLLSRNFQVFDVQDNKYYQEQDIDFICVSENEEIYSIECKYDNYLFYTHRGFIEHKHVYTEGKYKGETRAGWGDIENGSKADFLFYVEPKEKKIYICKMNDIQKYIKEHQEELTYKETNKDGYKITYGYLVDFNTFNKDYYLQIVQA